MKLTGSVAEEWSVAGSVAEGWIVAGDRELKRRDQGVTGVWIVAIGSWSVAIGASPASKSSRLGAEALLTSWSVAIESWSVACVWIVANDESAMASWGYDGDGRRSVARGRRSVANAKEGEASPVTWSVSVWGRNIWVSLMSLRNMGKIELINWYIKEIYSDDLSFVAIACL